MQPFLFSSFNPPHLPRHNRRSVLFCWLRGIWSDTIFLIGSVTTFLSFHLKVALMFRYNHHYLYNYMIKRI
ncbi:hypothetical protein SAMN03159294_5236 [Kosakonia radicincitans]|nr:hypothetical protein SAMN03159294_5236 [Kosakonia radicincitans]